MAWHEQPPAEEPEHSRWDIAWRDIYYFDWRESAGRGPRPVRRVATEQLGANYWYRLRGHGAYMVALVRSGRARLGLGCHWELLEPGGFFVATPGQLFDLRTDPADPLRFSYYSVSIEWGGRWIPALLGDRRPIWRLADDHRCDRLFDLMLSEAGAHQAQVATEQAALYAQLILRSAILGQASRDDAPSRAERRFQDCRRILHRDFTSLLTVADAAAACGLHPTHLARLFRDHADCTPLAYLQRLRMQRAADLLVETTLTVRQVAEELGIDDPYAFSRSFKRVMGAAPAHYREAQGRRP